MTDSGPLVYTLNGMFGFPMHKTPELRIVSLTERPVDPSGDFVVYWMTAFRRTRFNFALQRAIEWTNRLGKPLLIVEAVRLHYRWSCDRFHQFIIDGMIDNAQACKDTQAFYVPYVEQKAGAGSGLIEELGKRSCIVISDDFPCFFHPHLYQRVAKKWPFAMELVDSNGLMPLRATDRTFTVAHSYRRYMQKEIASHLNEMPLENPLQELKQPSLKSLPKSIAQRWPVTSMRDLEKIDLATLPIDHSVQPATEDDNVVRGGEAEARKCLDRFLKRRLADYAEARNEPDQAGSSWLSPYLHFGHISAHEIFAKITQAEKWEVGKLSKPNGSMNGFWNMSSNAEAFIDQLLTWREIGFNMCHREPNFGAFESLPEWAKTTLDHHVKDPRPQIYSLEELDQATTHDPLWNAAQRQLVREGRIHNYLRMLWGKKVLQWTRTPQEALDILIQLNNRYALDGRDPNSYSGIFWIFGRYDRAWGPERPIYGKVRYMTSESTQNKFHVKKYLEKHSGVAR